MKVRDSGMPDEAMWDSFFSPERILDLFGLDIVTREVAEFGCGYGTFTLATARLAWGTVHAFDIEPEMIERVREKCLHEGVANVRLELRDFVSDGTGLTDGSMDMALLFNILHHEEPVALMKEAFRILRPGGIAAIIHLNCDPTTPRGPALEIRPKPEQCSYHYGLLFRNPGPERDRTEVKAAPELVSKPAMANPVTTTSQT